MSQKTELKQRVEAKRLSLQARLKELQADASSESREQIKNLKAKLGELSEQIQDDWDAMTEQAAARLNSWLDEDKQ